MATAWGGVREVAVWSLLAGFVLLPAQPVSSEQSVRHAQPVLPDLSKIDRTIAKEPAYQGKPKYCLVVYGPEAKTRVWLVVDGDTLYADCKGDGDLTAEGNRFSFLKQNYRFEPIEIGPQNGTTAFTLVVESWIGEGETNYLIWCRPAHNSDGFRQRTTVLSFSEDKKNAPVVHFAGPLTLALFDWEKDTQDQTLTRNNKVNQLSILVGTPVFGGKYPAFAAQFDPFPEDIVPVLEVEFPAADPAGKPIKASGKVRHCNCHMRFWGEVRLPDGVGRGTARMTLRFPDWKQVEVRPAVLQVPIADE